jgi:hypothetical protein
MKNVFLALGLICVICVGCSQQPADAPHQLQAEVGAAIEEALQDPTGGSRDVQGFVNSAAPDGMARIPAGRYEIAGTITVPDGTRVVGAGMDKTILYRHPVKSRNLGGAIFSVQGQAGKGATQISGMAFVGVRDTNDKGEDYAITLTNCQDFRVDHCYFEGFGFAAVSTKGKSRGVIDHCTFMDNFKQSINNLGYGVSVYGANAWPDDPQLGTAEATFVEDCVMIGCRHAVASSAGAHYVFRHNLVQRNVVAHSVDAHGLGYGSPRGTRAVEIYDNVIEDPAHNWAGIAIRGGDGVIFDNTIKGFQNPVLLVLEWGTPDYLKSSYPAKDQIRDLWIWDNDTSGGPSEPVVDETATGFVDQGRDFFTEPKPGYAPFAYPHPLAQGGPFDGASEADSS